MVLLKTTMVVLLAVACVSAANVPTAVKASKEHVELNSDLSLNHEPTEVPPSENNTTTTSPNSTTTTTPTPTTPLPTTTLKPTTTSTTTSLPPNVTTTTPSPNVTTTTTTTTQSPNVTTTAIPPTPEPSPAPSPARSWDGPSFLGGMVLAFGIVAVGFVGYRFFYLGRGGAYHTL